MNNFGQTLRSARRQKGLTQSQLAEGLCDRTVVSRLESGTMSPPLDLIQQFANRLSMPQLMVDLVPKDVSEPSMGLAPLLALMRSKQYDEAFRVGEALFWTFNDFGAVKAMQKVADILGDIPDAPGRDRASMLSALLYQFIARQQLSDAFDVGLELIRSVGATAQYGMILTVAHGLLSLQPHESVKAILLIDLGTSHRRLGHNGTAVDMYNMGKAVAESEHLRHEHARALHGLSACYLESQNYPEAVKAAEEASGLYRSGEPLFWLAQQNTGIALLHSSRVSDGMKILERCGLFWETQQNEEAVWSVREDMAGL